jgi:hypothetical protein
MEAIGHFTAGFSRVLREKGTHQFLIAFFAGSENFNPDELGMEFLFFDEAAGGVPNER